MAAAQHRPLRAGDPTTLGGVELVGRLGEGGMGVVYLGRTSAGLLVAVKAIRAELADDDEFRRRFRGEVARARQVPPYCTAEVLDADPDSDPPYLVVEYVDGPSLADVIAARGPLSPANLHSVAIGVATALTAIHGAGVIHRDLKPGNVLLAQGSLKVIDFGIARPVTDATTLTDQHAIVGTVAYMAPERFGADGNRSLTPAADVFAWGAVVAYAGTGRVPFAADSMPATALRILDGEPDLEGLPANLRALVSRALAKIPAERPTARALIDMLTSHDGATAVVAVNIPVSGAPIAPVSPPPATALRPAPAVSGPPVVALAAGHGGGHAPGGGGYAPGGDEYGTGGAAGAGWPMMPTAAPAPPTALRADLDRPPTRRGPAPRQPTVYNSSGAMAPPTRRRGRTVAAAVLAAVVVLALAVAIATGLVPLPHGNPAAGASPSLSVAADPTGSSSPSATQAYPPAGMEQLLTDPMTPAKFWPADNANEPNLARCQATATGLLITHRAAGPFRCRKNPPDLLLYDTAVFVDVELLDAGSCAAIWLRFNSAGYMLEVCTDGYHLATHGTPSASDVTRLCDPVPAPLAVNQRVRVGVVLRGYDFTFLRDGKPIGRGACTDPAHTFGSGHPVLGIYTQQAVTDEAVPTGVRMTNVELWGSTS